MEERLNVARSSRFPLYKQLMWHAAAFYAECMEVLLPEGLAFLSCKNTLFLLIPLPLYLQGELQHMQLTFPTAIIFRFFNCKTLDWTTLTMVFWVDFWVMNCRIIKSPLLGFSWVLHCKCIRWRRWPQLKWKKHEVWQMWYACKLCLLHACLGTSSIHSPELWRLHVVAGAVAMTSWEREGLPSLLSALRSWSNCGRGSANIPASIKDPAGIPPSWQWRERILGQL